MSDNPPVAKKRLSVPVVLALLWIAENAAIAWFYRPWSGLPPLPAHARADGPAGENGTTSGRQVPGVAGERSVLKLEPFVVNLTDAGRHRYLKATIQIGLVGRDSAARAADDLSQVSPIRQTILEALASRGTAEVTSPEGKQALREEVRDRLNRAGLKYQVGDVYITDLLVQF